MNFSQSISEAITAQRFDAALDMYVSWLNSEPEFFQRVPASGSAAATHYRNAASLARKALFEKVQCVTSVSKRLDLAISYFFGLSAKQFALSLQQPAFFYIPDLPAKPFYRVEEISGLAELVQQLCCYKQDLLVLAQSSYQQYVDASGPVPKTADWQQVKPRWLSTHLLRGDVKTVFDDFALQQCQKLLEHSVVAHCPPHAAEAFVSTLLADAVIPPHYGISNVKLTVHIPLQVNSNCWLRAGDQQFTWSSDTDVLIFDDSFLHSAGNYGEQRRDVFIFDVWHPSLLPQEQNAIRHFMAEHQRWSEKYAKLAALDARL